VQRVGRRCREVAVRHVTLGPTIRLSDPTPPFDGVLVRDVLNELPGGDRELRLVWVASVVVKHDHRPRPRPCRGRLSLLCGVFFVFLVPFALWSL
jgi:hypothetical protein